MSEQTRHPDHDQIVEAVRGWFRLPFDDMGYRCQVRPFGAYWSTGMVFPSRAAVADPDAFLADVQARYGRENATVVLDDPYLAQSLGPILLNAGWREGDSDMFLAHTEAAPSASSPPGLALEPASEANLEAFAQVGLISFDDVERAPDQEELAAEMERQRAELAGTGRGLLALLDGVPAGIMRWFDESQDIWIRGLAVRPVYRRLGIGGALVRRGVADGYAAGKRSLLINVALKNSGAQRLYRRLGFHDEVYRRRQFMYDPDKNE